MRYLKVKQDSPDSDSLQKTDFSLLLVVTQSSTCFCNSQFTSVIQSGITCQMQSRFKKFVLFQICFL